MSVASPQLIAVVGVTASGKSALGTELAREFDGEIICADSRTVYKGMDIGTAKPTEEEQRTVRHHLLDIVEPGERFTAAEFKELATQAIGDISSRGKLPILVGGTGLYVDGVIFDYSFSAENDLGLRRHELDRYTDEELREMLGQYGITVPENEKNRRYLIRTLERGGDHHADRESLRPHTLVLGVSCDQAMLRQRIESRVESMFKRGLRREVGRLVDQYGWESEALTGIGYREFKDNYLGQASTSHVKRQIVHDTLQLAKHQRTWFKRNPYISWIETSEEAFDRVKEFLDAG